MKKSKFEAKYHKKYRRKKAMVEFWSKCYVCGSEGSLIILSTQPKNELSPLEIKKTKVICPACLLKDQPLLRDAPIEKRVEDLLG